MAVNQHVNKVILNGTTLMDVSDTTATAADVVKGKYFYLPNGQKVEGSIDVDTIVGKLDQLLARGIRKSNDTPQIWDVTNNQWSNFDTNGSANPTLILKNIGQTGNSITITDGLDYNYTFSMPDTDYVTVSLPHLGSYNVYFSSAIDSTQLQLLAVDVGSIGGVLTDEVAYVKPLSQCTNEEIAGYIEAHYNDTIDISDYWSIGDSCSIHIGAITNTERPDTGISYNYQTGVSSEKDVVFTIIDFNIDDLHSSVNNHTKAAITFCNINADYTLRMNCTPGSSSVSGNGQSYSDISNYQYSGVYNNFHRTSGVGKKLYDAFPATISSKMKTTKQYHEYFTGTYNGSYVYGLEKNDYEYLTYQDRIFIPDVYNYFGDELTYPRDISSSNRITGTFDMTKYKQYEYFKTPANRFPTNRDIWTSRYWPSPRDANTFYPYYVYYDNNNKKMAIDESSSQKYITICFCL